MKTETSSINITAATSRNPAVSATALADSPARRWFSSGSTRLSFIAVIDNERVAVMDLYTRIALACSARDLRFEIIFVDKGSKDGTWEEIQRLCFGDSRLHGTRVRPGTDDANALVTGFRVSSGDILFTLNAGYDDISQFPRLMARLEDGYDCVSGVTQTEHSLSAVRGMLDWTRRRTGLRLGSFRAGFKCYNARMIRNISRMLRLKDCTPEAACISRVNGCRAAEIVTASLKPLPSLRLLNHPLAAMLRRNPAQWLLVPSMLLAVIGLWICSRHGGPTLPSIVTMQMSLVSALGALYASGFSMAAMMARLALPARSTHKPQPAAVFSTPRGAAATATVSARGKSARLEIHLKPESTKIPGVPAIMKAMTAKRKIGRTTTALCALSAQPGPSGRGAGVNPSLASSGFGTEIPVTKYAPSGPMLTQPTQQPKKLVLIADDDTAIRQIMRIHMEMNGFLVIEASNGGQVLLQLETQPDLVLLDLMMPGVNGEECLREIHKRRPGLPVIVVSGRIDVEESKSEIDAVEFIAKPVDFNTMLAAVNRAMARSTSAGTATA